MPQQLVETATPDIGAIVGRDELCRVIMEDIRHSDTRRPHLLVGGVGAGKTAVLVRLTRLLAERPPSRYRSGCEMPRTA